MKFDEAQRWLDRADPQIIRDPSITKQIDQLTEISCTILDGLDAS